MSRSVSRWAMIGLIAVGVVSLVVWGVKAMSGGSEGQLVMATKEVQRGDIEVTVRGWGQLVATEEQDVISGAEGVVDEVFFQPGQQVSKGQVLATIDPGSLEVEIRKKEIELEVERVKLAQAFGVSPNAVSTVDPESALILRSSISGRVTGLAVAIGSTASGQVCTVVDDQRLVIRAQFPEPLFKKIRVGDKTEFAPDRFDGRHPGVVTKADPTPIKGSESYSYEVWVEMNNPGLLKVDDTGVLAIHTAQGDVQQKATINGVGSEEAVMAPFSGRVKTLFVRDGVFVKAGDPILEFEPGEALLNAMSMQLSFQQKEVELEDLKSQLENLEIISPIDGVATYRNINPGQVIAKGSIVTKVSNYTTMNLMLQVDEMDIPKIEEGQMAEVVTWGREGQQTLPAVVADLGAEGQPRDGLASFNITVRVENPGFLRPYMGAEAQIFVSKKENVLLCPVEALYKENELWYVDIAQGKNQRSPVEVEVGAMNDTYAEILSGLEEGDVVVVGMTKETDSPGSMRPFPIY
jgi:HlyD family secretion protein